MNTSIENENLKLEISTFGAELQKIENKKNGKNYLWHGDKAFWGRRAPVLFPFVGALKNKEYCYHDKVYQMGQHGFARDMEFELLEKYPFEFCLKIGYELQENKIKVMWKVENQGTQMMYFSIGAHPAFCVPVEQREECYLKFDTANSLANAGLENGLAPAKNEINPQINLENGYLKIVPELFKQDA